MGKALRISLVGSGLVRGRGWGGGTKGVCIRAQKSGSWSARGPNKGVFLHNLW